jgi:hypothetical protein
LSLGRGGGIPANGQERCDSFAGRCNEKFWASVCPGGTGFLVPPAE